MKTFLLALTLTLLPLAACSSSRQPLPAPDAYMGAGDGGAEAGDTCAEGCICFERACLCNNPALSGGECR